MLSKELIDQLRSLRWTEHLRPKGLLVDVPAELERLVSRDEEVRLRARNKLEGAVAPQGRLNLGAFHLLPFLLHLLEQPELKNSRDEVYALLDPILGGTAQPGDVTVEGDETLPLPLACDRRLFRKWTVFLRDASDRSRSEYCRLSALTILNAMPEWSESLCVELRALLVDEPNGEFRKTLVEVLQSHGQG